MPEEEVSEVDEQAMVAQIAQEAIAEQTRIQHDVLRALFPATDSGLMAHAVREMGWAGVGEPGSDYDGWAKECVLDLMRVFSSQGHSEGSAMLVLDLFERLAHFGLLAPLTQDPDEWMHIDDDVAGVPNLWQSRRRPDAFSTDGGQSWYYLDDPAQTEQQNFEAHPVMHRPDEVSYDGGLTWRPERVAGETHAW